LEDALKSAIFLRIDAWKRNASQGSTNAGYRFTTPDIFLCLLHLLLAFHRIGLVTIARL
jgi:hypothetical protein